MATIASHASLADAPLLRRLPAPLATAATALCLSLLAATALPPTAHATAALKSATLDFTDTDVESVARAMAVILGRPIVLDPRVKGKLTLYTDQAVTPKQAYAMFLSGLRGLGFAAVESNGLLKVVPEADAKLQTGVTATEAAPARPGERDQVVTQVFRLVHENANNLVPVLRPLISANNTINVNAGNNTLVITDYASNLARLATLISALDTPSATDVEVIPLQHAVAADLAPLVQRLTDGSSASPAAQGGSAPATAAATGSATSASIVADTRANALLVRAPNPARLAAIRALTARLDRPGASGAGGSNVHVIYLKNLEATRLAAVLRAAFAPEASRASSAGGGSTVIAGIAPTSATSGAGSTGNNGSSSSSSASPQATNPVTASAQPSIGGYIQADPSTNSLIVTAPEPLFRELRSVVDLLDSRRAQLYVESLVVEVEASKALDVGLQWKQIFNISSSTDLTLGTVAQALESMAGTNILSTANVVTLDNEEAKIVVGQNVPFVTGSYTTSSSSASPFQTIERKDVGITLRIRPQIGENGTIRMTIFQESSSVSSSTSPGTTNAGPTTNKRSIESTVVVGDGKIIVLGGLIEDRYSGEASEIVGLAKLPLVGPLFRTMSRSRKKTNLVVFLRPLVMRDDVAADQMTLDRYDFIRARQREIPEDVRQVLPPGTPMPELPAPPEAKGG